MLDYFTVSLFPFILLNISQKNTKDFFKNTRKNIKEVYVQLFDNSH